MIILTRRRFLQLTTGSVLGTAAAVHLNSFGYAFADSPRLEAAAPPAPFGRVATYGVDIRQDPSRAGKLVRTAKRDEVIPLIEQIPGEAVMAHNDIWFKTTDGYMYSSWVQPVYETRNKPRPELLNEPFWGQITFPFSVTRWAPDDSAKAGVRLYYSSIYRVVAAKQDANQKWWYQLAEGVTFGPGPYVPAEQVRPILPEDLTPLSTDISKKHIEVDLSQQMLTAFEDDEPVLSTRVASGYGTNFTPQGNHRVLYKNPTSRMIGGQGTDYYDLPGVPFPTYITPSAVAIHGAYWHNDFGRPRSHGCLNVPAPIAIWTWRWTEPHAPYEIYRYYTPNVAKATEVIVRGKGINIYAPAPVGTVTPRLNPTTSPTTQQPVAGP